MGISACILRKDCLQEDAELLDQMQVEKDDLEKSHEEIIRQMEEDTDQEIEELKQMYSLFFTPLVSCCIFPLRIL